MRKQMIVLVCLMYCSILSAENGSLRDTVGQHFILTLPQTEDRRELRTWLERCRPAGVMLLSSHCTERKKTKKLIDDLQKDAAKIGIPPLIVAIDWEGGIVARMHEEGGCISVPSPYALAGVGRDACFCAGLLIGQQLHDLGINCDFAPSVDLFNTIYPTLATRCFSDDPTIVADCAIAFAHGLLTQGVVPVIKHFPGLGLGSGDTHFQGVTVTFDAITFKRHTQPFIDTLKAGLPCAMGGHARCTQYDNLPATLSKKAVDVLKQANPDVLLMTDDFSMKGVNGDMPLAKTVLTSLKAGYHVLIYSAVPEQQVRFLDDIANEIETDPVYQELHQRRLDEVARLREKLFGQSRNQVNVTISSESFAKNLARSVVKISNRRDRLFSKKSQGEVQLITVDLPKIRPSEPWFIDQDRKSCLSRSLTFMTGCTVNEYVLDPRDDASLARLEDIIKKCKPHDTIVLQTFFFGNGVWNENQTQWLETVQKQCDKKRVTIFSLGHPSEQAIIPDATIVHLGSFHNPMIEAALYHLSNRPTITGAQRLVWHPERYLKGKRFGLLCHKASCVITRGHQAFLPDVVYPWARAQNDQTRLVALFSPEHGLLGTHHDGAVVSSDVASKWGCPVYSLHGASRKPSPEMLKGLDLLVIDLQDVGLRCYTYLSTLQQMLEAAKEQDLEVLVLDRPNPLFFWDASGPMLQRSCESFVGKVYTPFVYGSTIGKLAKELNKTIEARLKVVGLIGGNSAHDCFFTEQFVAPSPNLGSLEAVHIYPITVCIEGTNYSEGRGTSYPFQQIGAPWVDSQMLADKLNSKKSSGIYFQPISFTPHIIKGKSESPKHESKQCNGVFVHIIDSEKVDPTRVARTILETLFEMYPEQSLWARSGKRYMIDLLVGTPDWRLAITPESR